MRNILQIETSSEILRKKAQSLTKSEILSNEVQSLISEMKEIMRNAPGVGLAAPQIGLSVQLIVIEDPEERLKEIPLEVLKDRGRIPVKFHVLINPKIVELSGKTNYFFEGCLSIKKRARIIPRSESIQVEYLDEDGVSQVVKANGWYARILQHEIAHLNGQLCIDISDIRTEIELTEENRKKFVNATMPEILKFYKERCPDAIIKTE